MRALLLTVFLASMPFMAGCDPRAKEEALSSVTGTYEVTNVFPRVHLRVALKNLDTGETLDEVYVQQYRGGCTLGKDLLGSKHALTITTYRQASGLRIHRIDNSRPFCEGKFW